MTSSTTRRIPPDQLAELDLIRREVLGRRTADGPLPWGELIVGHLITGPEHTWSDLHRRLNTWHRDEATRPPGAMDAVAAPRGHGKTTAGVEVPTLWHVARCTRRFVVIASDTWSQAVQRIATIATEVETNDLLRTLYPNLRPAYDTLGRLVAWRDDELALACGCRIVGVGAGKSIRGAKVTERRPDLLLLDDLEDDASVATAGARAKRLRWITRTALALAGPRQGISALWVGTILSRSSLLNLATGAALDTGQDRPSWARPWTPSVYRAEQPDTPAVESTVFDESGFVVETSIGTPLTYPIRQPLWSELTREDLASIRFRLGPASYAAEYLSDPVDESTALFAPPRSVHYLNPTAAPLARLIAHPSGRVIPVAALTRAAALDPQYADKRVDNDPDLAAVVVAGQYGAETFLLDAWIGRDRHGQAARLVDYAVRWSCYAAGVEAKSAQATTADAAAADGRVPIVALNPVAGKVERALPLAARLGDSARPESCRVFVLPDAEHLRPYLERFPHGRYDDPVDATVYAVELAARAAPVQTGGGPGPALGGPRS